MPVNIPVEWAIVKMPDVYRPYMRSQGRVFRGTPPVVDQDQPGATRAELIVTTDEQLFAMNVSEMLNRELRREGYWMVSWAHAEPTSKAPLEMVCRWLDRDKDVQFRVWFEGPFSKVATKPLEDIVEACERAWQEWFETIRHRLEVSPSQMVKAQKGERVADLNFGPDVFGA